MPKSSISAALTLIIATAASPVGAVDGNRYLGLAQCIAYATVKGGLDGQKPVPKEYAEVLSVLGDEYMFEASALGMDDDQAQTFVVNELVRQNRIKKESGIETLKAELGASCSALAETLIGGRTK